MFSNQSTLASTTNSSKKISSLKNALDNCDCVVIGAGAGLSTAAGYEYSAARFKKYFSDFEAKYGFHDMYTGGFYPYSSEEEFWAFWSRNIYVNRYKDGENETYKKLFELVKNKDYFVITTNVDHCFQKSGFDKKRLFYTQGDYGLLQCAEPCCDKTFDNEEIIAKMVKEQKNMKIPSRLIPKCPVCGGKMTTNLRCDESFVQDKGWYEAAERYGNFIRSRENQKILFLELGVGYNTPSIIKYPFWQMTAKNPKAVYACVNLTDIDCPAEIENQSICIRFDINKLLNQLLYFN